MVPAAITDEVLRKSFLFMVKGFRLQVAGFRFGFYSPGLVKMEWELLFP